MRARRNPVRLAPRRIETCCFYVIGIRIFVNGPRVWLVVWAARSRIALGQLLRASQHPLRPLHLHADSCEPLVVVAAMMILWAHRPTLRHCCAARLPAWLRHFAAPPPPRPPPLSAPPRSPPPHRYHVCASAPHSLSPTLPLRHLAAHLRKRGTQKLRQNLATRRTIWHACDFLRCHRLLATGALPLHFTAQPLHFFRERHTVSLGLCYFRFAVVHLDNATCVACGTTGTNNNIAVQCVPRGSETGGWPAHLVRRGDRRRGRVGDVEGRGLGFRLAPFPMGVPSGWLSSRSEW